MYEKKSFELEIGIEMDFLSEPTGSRISNQRTPKNRTLPIVILNDSVLLLIVERSTNVNFVQ